MKFEPRKLPTVLTADELLDKAFRKASKVSGRNKKEKTLNKLATVSNVLSSYFDRIITSHPNYSALPDFYREMIDVVIGLGRLRKSLAALKWADGMIQKIITKSVREVKGGKNPEVVIKAAYGRIASIVNQIDDELRFLNEAKQKMRQIPVFGDEPVVVVAGYPNVGKSSFVARISTVQPEIATYPFTTKEIYVGIADIDGRVQVVDTPGLLDRPIHKRNPIERRAILCLKHLADCILFIIDPTETCGYRIESQLSLLEEVKTLEKPVIAVYSKADMHDRRDLPAFSSVTGEGIEEVVELIREVLKSRRSEELGEQVACDSGDVEEG
ncbi:NOG1 family protein [Archaeoglobus veneficus]|uniref:Nucleolar GTP-binding-1 domain protein n=1 Tax=Archaeoglobus veneficus (strain DSM 11195 / SNP6) TaxID=693661 RepID=F2KS49_ARCVS|nr:GTPase [Archaeoglobus veneficus]AEA47988.1 Nucleolar GTP-binding-1 domain protein [Archaeoglobus veneficus SNP6]